MEAIDDKVSASNNSGPMDFGLDDVANGENTVADGNGVMTMVGYEYSSAGRAQEWEEDEEFEEIFKIRKKKKRNDENADEIALSIEEVMAELEVVAEEDAEMNRQGKPAINKLRKLSLLIDNLSKKQLQREFLDHGILTLMRNWLEPLPDGSLPNINIRAAVLQILNDFPIDLEQHCRIEQLRRSGLGKVIVFLSKSDEETTANRKLAKELFDKWSRSLFGKKTSFGETMNTEDEMTLRRPSVKKAMIEGTGSSSCHNHLAMAKLSQGSKYGESSSRQLTLRPEAMPMEFKVRPKSKVDPDEVRARARRSVPNQRHEKLNKKLEQMRAPKRKQLQATKISVEGRDMVKYF